MCRLRIVLALACLTGPACGQNPVTPAGPAPASQDAAAWLTDWELAKRRAADQDKDLLVVFTGSDWCAWCIRLKDEVTGRPAFVAAAAERFVLVELDFPQDRGGMSAELVAQNERLRETYDARNLPLVLLLDATGRPYAQTSYQALDPLAYAEHLTALRATGERVEALVEAAAAVSGLDRARQLAAAVDAVPRDLQRFHVDRMRAVVALDAENEAGLKARFERRLAAIALIPKKRALFERIDRKWKTGDFAAARAALVEFRDEHIAAIDAPTSFELHYWEGTLLDRLGDTAAAIEALEAARRADPDNPSAEPVGAVIDALRRKLGKR